MIGLRADGHVEEVPASQPASLVGSITPLPWQPHQITQRPTTTTTSTYLLHPHESQRHSTTNSSTTTHKRGTDTPAPTQPPASITGKTDGVQLWPNATQKPALIQPLPHLCSDPHTLPHPEPEQPFPIPDPYTLPHPDPVQPFPISDPYTLTHPDPVQPFLIPDPHTLPHPDPVQPFPIPDPYTLPNPEYVQPFLIPEPHTLSQRHSAFPNIHNSFRPTSSFFLTLSV
ncbi:hypothetical protein Pmani_037123 [Petrolisthes manimaculis]|uniref:Uncharacterized protein n=1 Tax=Petrolisthes manimaculis TaxID=1843537 RepID=A0AAE1TLT0_9EUCA|nr:hypothetical protein Pmani_037123 [Petrolisthes manimaculis]